jgi:uncharacterized protein YacL
MPRTGRITQRTSGLEVLLIAGVMMVMSMFMVVMVTIIKALMIFIAMILMVMLNIAMRVRDSKSMKEVVYLVVLSVCRRNDKRKCENNS